VTPPRCSTRRTVSIGIRKCHKKPRLQKAGFAQQIDIRCYLNTFPTSAVRDAFGVAESPHDPDGTLVNSGISLNVVGVRGTSRTADANASSTFNLYGSRSSPDLKMALPLDALIRELPADWEMRSLV
jgi:hypothetical protein